ncbi:Homocysteine S-methyltransferase [Dothidotthia symphoricarpi CBS 119687]|uniref:Homocysteine S-methyltransferase n=1 Tax=Dothidotthia symphoricarpi CBS 119687 TaxID=1392245 RepID=A0A6A6AGE4_9PLEO|nr:Homocysteine S-methyltransferase [Dothidotthia symphoricarpi CBS 119687]KAF2130118.1 Homocysteine S-methyltransferase [Dothidotthia symphoricarpi CBS 119687]
MSPSQRPEPISSYFPLKKPIILDGALATYLETLGADISGSLWSADILTKDPSVIKQAHLDYFRAGANVAITASYQASIPGLVQHLQISEEEARGLVARSVELAISARDEVLQEREDEKTREPLWIAGSVGPYGAFLADGSEYRGDYTVSKEAMKEFHRGRIAALIAAGVDILACETIPQKGEVEALAELLVTEFPRTEAWFSFTLRDSTHIADGTPLADIVDILQDVKQVVALGFNCVADGVGLDALRVLKGLWTRGPLVMYPNSGEMWNAGTRGWEGVRTEGEGLRGKTVLWWEAGAGLIGGCCRTTPVDIGVMRGAVGR